MQDQISRLERRLRGPSESTPDLKAKRVQVMATRGRTKSPRGRRFNNSLEKELHELSAHKLPDVPHSHSPHEFKRSGYERENHSESRIKHLIAE